MRCAKVVGVALAMTVMVWALWAEAHLVDGGRRERETPGRVDFSSAAEGDTIWSSGFEPGDSLWASNGRSPFWVLKAHLRRLYQEFLGG